ncbi:MAG: xanthine dehydrogenase family protein molybdopterin-binding subunit [Meiothermus sp.]|nr:xanthine dehydrogenase family protein molybdopterin-binding subunit [Meiothermus sp.]
MSAATHPENRYIGKPLKRLEDPKFITGAGAYLEDITPENTLRLALLRSPYAHAELGGVDASEALKLPGVVAVFTAADVPEIRLPASASRDVKVAAHLMLATDRVRYAGEPVAAVLASSAAAAEDALGLISVDYQPLPAVAEVLEAATDQHLLHPSLGTNIAQSRKSSADASEPFAQAHTVVGARMVQQRVAGNPLEGRGVLATWDGARGTLTVYSSTQSPHDLRSYLAGALELAENQVRVIAPDVGGAFGVKIHPYPEDFLVAYLARRTGRPVKWIEGRSESFLATSPGRAQVADLEMAFDAEGKILGLRGRVVADVGAYGLDSTFGNAPGTVLMLQGPYEIPVVQADLLMVYTNATPTGAYRGAGRPEATYYLERLLDMGARALRLDPAELRRRNFIGGPFPYTTRTKAKYDSGDYPKTLERLLEVANYPALRAQQAQARAEGRLVGLGFCTYVEITGFGWETGGVRVNADGSAVVFTGTSPHGQGAATSFAQIVAEKLGVEFERVQLVHGDTTAVPFGMGTMGSRTLHVGGSAVLKASDGVREKMLRIAAHLLEAAPEDVELTEKGWAVRGVPDKAVSTADIAQAAYNPRKLPQGLDPGLEGQASFTLKDATFPFGAHLVMLEVDPETGQVRLLRHVSVDDAGNIVNPLLFEGQQHGGVAQGIGQALLEGVAFDAEGQNLTASLLNYTLPRAGDLIGMEVYHNQTTTTTNPLGAKGIGEAGTIGATPAAVNAVLDALGVEHLDMPLTPEKVWRAIQR